jgi:hypothetical protein
MCLHMNFEIISRLKIIYKTENYIRNEDPWNWLRMWDVQLWLLIPRKIRIVHTRQSVNTLLKNAEIKESWDYIFPIPFFHLRIKTQENIFKHGNKHNGELKCSTKMFQLNIKDCINSRLRNQLWNDLRNWYLCATISFIRFIIFFNLAICWPVNQKYKF